jgi:uncharacterized protein (TIGR02246 family)
MDGDRRRGLTAPIAGDSIYDVDQMTAQEMVDAMADAWNRGDANQFTAQFLNLGTFTNIDGKKSASRDDFRERLVEHFKLYPGRTISMKVRSVQLVRREIAVVNVDRVGEPVSKFPPNTPADEKGIVRMELGMIMVHEGGRWLVSATFNTAVVPP